MHFPLTIQATDNEGSGVLNAKVDATMNEEGSKGLKFKVEASWNPSQGTA
jgi:hypothetical protein